MTHSPNPTAMSREAEAESAVLLEYRAEIQSIFDRHLSSIDQDADVINDIVSGPIARLAATLRSHPATAGGKPGEALLYTDAVADAGQSYLKSVSLNGEYHLSGTFRWQELFDAMVAAALTPTAQTAELSYSGAPMPPDGIEGCVYCGEAFKEGDLVLDEVDGGRGHATCCGPDRESYVGADGDPLKDDEPIPTGYSRTPTSPSKSSGEEA